ncbi:MAG: MmcQ/YjbR family DNA-binding protein [Deltaproteobacteria bacterium]|nr:MmcQ/YjbR family DNA-binding protein [Deltaproteobacteria bacterium]
MARKKTPTDDVLKQLRAFGLAYPGAHTKSPWPGHLDLAVKDKTFAYLSLEGEPLHISCKLPNTSAVALMLPFCKPTAYGLGKAGWVSASFEHDAADVDMLKAWVDESYRAQAPKTLVKQIGVAGSPPPAKSKANASRKPKAKKTKSKPSANKR